MVGADLTAARLEKARMVGTNLRDARLTGARVYGLSAWDVCLEGAAQDSLAGHLSKSRALFADAGRRQSRACDSGASDVSIPADVFSTLIRTGTVSSRDFLEKRVYELADGSKQQSQRFRIRSLRVGSLVLRDVVASVAPPAASLLLGQSFLSRLRSWSIDNQRQVWLINESHTFGAGEVAANSEEAAPASMPAIGAPNDIAEFHGTYVCPQGLTGLSLRILGTSTGSTKYAIFTFGPSLASIPGVLRGSFSVQGQIDLAGGSISTTNPSSDAGSQDWVDDFLNHLGQDAAQWNPNASIRIRPAPAASVNRLV